MISINTELLCYRNDRYNVDLFKLEENNIAHAIKNFTLLKPELRKLLVGKRLNSNKKKIYTNLEQLNEEFISTKFIHFPLINWTDKDVENFFNPLFLPYYMTKS